MQVSISYSALLHDYFAATDRRIEMSVLEAIHAYHCHVETRGKSDSEGYVPDGNAKGTGNAEYTLPTNAVSSVQTVTKRLKAFGHEYVKVTKRTVHKVQDKLSRTTSGIRLTSPSLSAITGGNVSLPSSASLGDSAKDQVAKAIRGSDGKGKDTRTLRQRDAHTPKAMQLIRMVQHDAKLSHQIEIARQLGKVERVDNLTDQQARNREAINMLYALCPELRGILPEVIKAPMPVDTHKATRLIRKRKTFKRFGTK